MSASDEVWHELALSLGDTVESLKSRMSAYEFHAWCEYRKRRGPLNPMLRFDAAIARLAYMVNRAMGGRAELSDFMPWANDEQPATLDRFVNELIGTGG